MSDGATAWGAYGLRFEGFVDPARFLVPVGADLPLVVVTHLGPDGRHRPASTGVAVLQWDATHAEMWLDDESRLELDRDDLRLRLVMERAVDDEALAHPFSGLAAMVASEWLGRQILHGGAVAVGGRAWAILGTKEAGKSSTVGWFARAGHAVLCDDLVVIDEQRRVCAGPRCVDLRADPARVLGGVELQILPNRRRWRIHLGAVEPAVPLGGIVLLDWGERTRVEQLTPSEALSGLLDQSALGADPASGLAYLDLAAVPALRLVRPQRLDRLDEAGAALLAAIS